MKSTTIIITNNSCTFEKAYHFSEICLFLDALTQNLHYFQQVCRDSGIWDFQKDYVPMYFDLMQAK